MTVHGLDPRYSFDGFVVGSANRLAAAAAKRVAEAPGKAYNPLFLYGASGLGKTHLLMAIGLHAARIAPHTRVVCDTLERVTAGAPGAQIESSGRGDPLDSVQLLLLDDAQALAGDRRAQETLLAWWDALVARGTQIVLAADRPPSEIDPIDHRLASRLCAGLIADIGPPDFESRVVLIRRKVEERGHRLAEGVPEALARVAFANVRELQGGLNRILAAEELDGKPVSIAEVTALLGQPEPALKSEEFDAFFAEVAGAVDEIATRVTPEQRIVDAILRYEGEGFRTFRLEQALREPPSERVALDLVDRFRTDVSRLAAIADEIRALDAQAPELARIDLLRNPDRVLEAEALVAHVHERSRPLPLPPPGPGFIALSIPDNSPAAKAAREVVRAPGVDHNPLYVLGPPASGRSALLAALAQQLKAAQPMLPLAFVAGPMLAAELEEAAAHGHAASWRARYRRARVLVIDDIDLVRVNGDARETLFELFDSVRRAGGQLIFAGEADPSTVDGPADRLRALLEESSIQPIGLTNGTDPALVRTGPGEEIVDAWFLNREKVLLQWPYVEDLLETELD
ncbi:MAG: DnaA ATPase domain-containing protein [Longimicrobiales bacterium]